MTATPSAAPRKSRPAGDAGSLPPIAGEALRTRAPAGGERAIKTGSARGHRGRPGGDDASRPGSTAGGGADGLRILGWRAYAERFLLTLLRGLEIALVVLAVTVACLPYRGFFSGAGFLVPVLGAAVGGALLAVLASVRGWTRLSTVAVSAGGFLALATFVVSASTLTMGLPTLDTAAALGNGLRSGPARMLTVALPADPTPDLVLWPALLAWTAAAAGALLAWRTAVPLAPLAPPIVVLGAALLLTAARPRGSMAATAVLCGVLLVLALVRANRVAGGVEEVTPEVASSVGLDVARQRWSSTAARLAFGIPAVAAVLAAAVAGTALLPFTDGSDRFDPRVLIDQPVQLSEVVTPLARVKSLLQQPAEPQFSVALTGADTDTLDRVRVAALPQFDGALWTTDGDYLVGGTILPEPEGPRRGSVSRMGLDVKVQGLPGPFLPVAGRPVRMSGTDFAVSPATGDLVTTATDPLGYRYTAQTDVPRPDDALATAQVSRTAQDARYTRLPNPPAWLLQEAAARDMPGATPYAKLVALEKSLRALPYDVSARPGHSYGALARLLTAPRAERVGYAEQYASAFAVLARAWNYPARVAVGYRLRPEKLRDGSYAVDSRDAHAWPEVHFAGYGWVPFEPTSTKGPSDPVPPRPTPPAIGDERAPLPSTEGPDIGAGVVGGQEPSGPARVLWWALTLLAAIVLLLALIVAAKELRRRSRRTTGPPSQRIMAAWRETTDRLREWRLDTALDRTPLELATAAEKALGMRVARPVRELAGLVTTALYAPAEPDLADVRRAWELESQFRRSGGETLLVRARVLLDPRPLLPHRWRDVTDRTLAALRRRWAARPQPRLRSGPASS